MKAKLDDVLEMTKINELLNRKEEKNKPANVILWVLAIIGVIAAVAGIAAAVYHFMAPSYEDDYDDEYDDDFEDDLDEDSDESTDENADEKADVKDFRDDDDSDAKK